MRASRRPKKISTSGRATWVESSRSVGSWKLPTLSEMRVAQGAVEETLGANGSWTWTMSNGTAPSSASSVRLASTGTGAGRGPRAARQRHPAADGEHPRARAAREQRRRAAAAARLDRGPRRPAPSARDSEGAAIRTRWPRRAARRERRATNSLTSWRAPQGWGVTWTIASGLAGPRRQHKPAPHRASRDRAADALVAAMRRGIRPGPAVAVLARCAAAAVTLARRARSDDALRASPTGRGHRPQFDAGHRRRWPAARARSCLAQARVRGSPIDAAGRCTHAPGRPLRPDPLRHRGGRLRAVDLMPPGSTSAG